MIRFNEDGNPTHGIFDDMNSLVRQRYIEGRLTHNVTKMWIETKDMEAFNRLDDWAKHPWGHYPELPTQMKKR